MNDTPYQALIENAALLIALVFLFDVIVSRLTMRKMTLLQIPLGILIGVIGIEIMNTQYILRPGVVFDTRSILLGISGLFFGLVPTAIAVLMTAIFRISQGGAATIMGVAVIVTSGLIGILWRHFQVKNIAKQSLLEMYGFGILLHINMLVMAFLLPWTLTKQILSNVAVPVMIIYPFGTALLGLLMVNSIRREQTTEELAHSEIRLRLAVESGNIGLYDRDLGTNTTNNSLEWKRQLGFEEGEISNNYSEWESRLHPDDRDIVLARVDDYVHEKIPFYEAEYRMRHKDGTYRWILSHGLIHKNGNGGAGHLIGTHIDITKQKEIGENLQKSEQRFRGLAESSQDVIALYDRENRHVYMNSAGLKFAKSSITELIGHTHREIGIDLSRCEIIENEIQKVFSTGIPTQHLFDWETPEGCSYLDWRLTPVLGNEGNVDLVLGMARDITGLKKAEEDLKKSSEQYKVLTENIKDVVWIIDTETLRFRYISPSVERLRGYTVEEIMEQPVSAALTPEAYDQLVRDIGEIIKGYSDGTIPSDKFYTNEVPQPCKDGSIVWTEVVTNFYKNEETGHIEVRGVSRDISERKHTDEIMAHAQHELHRMLIEADQSRIVLLSVAEDQKLAQEALARTAKELVQAYDATLQGWSAALELRERETAGHSQRVVQCTLDLAQKMGVDEDLLIHIQRGALLHDIGKMGIPDSILLKPGPLTDDEWNIMRQHPTYARRLLSNISYLSPALDIPLFHHERWDGSGYPDGMKGKDIPLTARIFAVVDVWDALSSDRPYRPAWDAKTVKNYLHDQAGKQFDPKIVDAFLDLIDHPD